MPPSASTPLRSVSAQASEVLEQLARQRRRTIRLPADVEWLAEVTDHPQRLLSRMAAAGNLYRLDRGRYLVAPRGTSSAEQAAPLDLMVDLVLGAQGPYYLAFLTALISHRLTDLHSSVAYAAIRRDSTFKATRVELPGYLLRTVRVTRFPSEAELERRRVLEGTKEFAWRSTIERTLVDGLMRPDLCAGIETVVSSWARAVSRDVVDWRLVARAAHTWGSSAVRRVAFMLLLLERRELVDELFGELDGRRYNVPFDRSNSFRLDRTDVHRDSVTGVIVNVPRDHLRGWLNAVEFGG